MDPSAAANPPAPQSDDHARAFIERWQVSGGAERANYGLFLSELCDLLGVLRPDPAGQVAADDAYVLEKAVKIPFADGSESDGRIDLCKRGCFVLEAKQGGEALEPGAAAAVMAEATRQKLKGRRKGTATRGTSAWDQAMIKARNQAEQYARSLPTGEPQPPQRRRDRRIQQEEGGRPTPDRRSTGRRRWRLPRGHGGDSPRGVCG